MLPPVKYPSYTHTPDPCGFAEGDKGSCGHQTEDGRVAWVLLYQSRIILYKPVSMILISMNTFMHEFSNDVNVFFFFFLYILFPGT